MTLTATITDGDGDTDTAVANIGGSFQFEDDGPSISAAAAAIPTLAVDETDFATNASASFAGLFTPAFGNDGPRTPTTTTSRMRTRSAMRWAFRAVPPGLVDTLTKGGDPDRERPAVVRAVGAGRHDVFTITVRRHRHCDARPAAGGGAQRSGRSRRAWRSAATLAANLVTLTATITDGDGDTDTAVANIGGSFQFEDDGPSIVRRRRRCRRWRLTRPTLRPMRRRRLRACSRRPLATTGSRTRTTTTSRMRTRSPMRWAFRAGCASGLVDTLTNAAVTLT